MEVVQGYILSDHTKEYLHWAILWDEKKTLQGHALEYLHVSVQGYVSLGFKSTHIKLHSFHLELE